MDTTIQKTDTYREVMAWLRGGDTTPDEEMEGRFIDILAQLVAEKLDSDPARPRRRRAGVPAYPLSLKAIMSEMGVSPDLMRGTGPRLADESQTEVVAADQSPAEPLDSLMAAKALRQMSLTEGMELTMSQIQAILYIAYGVWLAKHGTRLFEEHPQMWQYGPVFPRAYAKLRKDESDCREQYDILRCRYPDRFRFLSNCFRRFAWTKACILTSPHIGKGSPWAETRRSNPDRWGARIEDDLIRGWFLPKV